MHFPVTFQLGRFALPAHVVFESAAYLLGYRTYLALRSHARDPISDTRRWTMLAAAAVGALAGSNLLAWAQHFELWRANTADLTARFSGKTIVGGLLGGWLAIEWVKRLAHERRRTGDLYVLPLCVGIAIGRVGCFLAGLGDHTYGNPTTLPWGVDFGDGMRRHPAQLYEIVALMLIAAWAIAARRRIGAERLLEGDAFRGFMSLYLVFRLALEAIKPEPRLVFGLSAIQLACVLGVLYLLPEWPRVFGLAPARAEIPTV